MIMKKVFGVILMILWVCPLSAQKSMKYRIYLSDKNYTTYRLDQPQAFLSQRAIDRRVKQHLAIDSTDLPVNPFYIQQIRQKGVEVVNCSKWNNTVLVQTRDEALMEHVSTLPFVVKMRKVWVEPDSIPARNKDRKKQINKDVEKTEHYYGDGFRQIAIHNGDSLHQAGFQGQGMQIAVIDAGFYNADVIPMLKKVNLLGTHDFVNPHSDIYEENSHGMMVLSCMAANQPKVLVGTAPEASYWLLRSEDNDTEQPVEEDYWAAAVEFADSVGVDVLNTSLGYHEFDNKMDNYRYRDLDGHVSLMSNTASMIADKGMVLVCSAGNSGSKTWKKITPPGDAENVITVGAMNRDLVNANFSSLGDTSDGRVKPDVMAVGVYSAVSGVDGQPSHANGTSFASPTFCGLVACFWQSCPHLTAKEVIQAIIRSADRLDYPDNVFGYGIADVWKAYQMNKQ